MIVVHLIDGTILTFDAGNRSEDELAETAAWAIGPGEHIRGPLVGGGFAAVPASSILYVETVVS